ncbi:MAG: hypothetical protein ABW217_17670 [Polyangiaceae bacterium]
MPRTPETARALRRIAALALLALLVCLALRVDLASAGQPAGFRVIVHPANPLAAAERDLLSDVFLKKKIRWPDGEPILPVDQRFDAAVRERFSEAVLRRSVFAVRSYWQQLIFTGRGVPPPELDSDEAVVRYVRSNRGAVGYVGAGTALSGVKGLDLR